MQRYCHSGLALPPFRLAGSLFRSFHGQADGGLLLVCVCAARVLCWFVLLMLPPECGGTCGNCASRGKSKASFHATECASAMSLAHQHPFNAIPRRIWLASVTALQPPLCPLGRAASLDVILCVPPLGRPKGYQCLQGFSAVLGRLCGIGKHLWH